MAVKVILSFLVILFVLLIFVAQKDGHFRYQKSALIAAPASAIYPYLSQLKLGAEWNPYDLKDKKIERVYSGIDGTVGSSLAFEGDSKTGAGSLTVVRLQEPSEVDIQFVMRKPFHAENLIEYRLTPEGNETRFSWAMSGDGGFLRKLMNTFMDCEKMMTQEFDVGIANLKKLVETKGAK